MYHPQVGDPLEALDTPVMLVDLDLMENNIASLMARFRERRVLVSPHLKTVKSPELARVLLAAGASDGCVAKVSEAEVMVQGGKLFGMFLRESHMATKQKRWIYSPRKPVPPHIPEDMQMEVTKKTNALIDTSLKLKYLQPPPENPQFNYIVDISGKWYRSYFYFCSRYCCPGPNALSPTFEARFTRLQYAGNGRFNLAYMRYTGQWWEVYRGLTLDECLARIREEPLFHP